MASSVVTKILAEQRKRMLASIMRAAEDETWWGVLQPAEKERFRTQVVGSINVFYELCRDIVKVSEDDGVRNDEAVRLLQQIHTSQRQVEGHIRAGTASSA